MVDASHGLRQALPAGPLREVVVALGRTRELIQWLRGECPHKESIDAGREGMHHLRFRIHDLDSKVAEAEALGFRAVWGKRYNDNMAVAYLERDGDPLWLELFENNRA